MNGIDMSKLYDGIIIGGGPAGLSAAIYLARAKYRVLVIEKEKMGGQITITSEVVNYPGVPETDGRRLTENMRQQAEFFGAEFMMADVKELNPDGDVKKVVTDKGIFETLGIVLATGASPRKIGFEGEIKYQGRGVAYCATCDGEFFTGLDVFVLGGGFAAAEESVFLTKYAKKVTVIVREEDFTCAAAVAEQVKNHPGIEVHYQTEIVEAGGESTLQYAVFRNNETGETWRYEPPTGKSFGIFVFAGYAPATGLFKEFLELNEDGYLVTDMNQKTSKDGIYGAGDICVKNLRQVVTAVSDGAVAATSLEKYLSGMYEKLQLPEREISTPERRKPTDVPKQESAETGGFLTEEMKQQLVPVFERLEKDVVLKFYTDDSPISRKVEEFAGPLMSRLLCLEFLVELNRASMDDKAQYLPTGVLNYRVSGLISYINEHLDEDLSIGTLSSLSCISPYHMMRIFKEETGCTIGNYITEKRLIYARDLLSEGVNATDALFSYRSLP